MKILLWSVGNSFGCLQNNILHFCVIYTHQSVHGVCPWQCLHGEMWSCCLVIIQEDCLLSLPTPDSDSASASLPLTQLL